MVRSEESYANTLRLSREAKRRRTGTCRVCGATTRYSGRNGKAVSDLCQLHAAAESGKARRGTGANSSRLLEVLDGPRSRLELYEATGIPYAQIDVTLNRLMGYGLVERVSRGVYRRVA